jgi:hypothetical protein
MLRLSQNIDIIPLRIRLGVTGHRTLLDTKSLAATIEEILAVRYLGAFTAESRKSIEDATSPPVVFTIISPLAEGADRLVASIVLKHNGYLEVLLPMPKDEYEKDFSTIESRDEFASLIARAHRVEVTECNAVIGEASYRQKAYRRVGEETIERCDILLALWDEKKTTSECGTGAIVALALDKKKPVFILSTIRSGAVELKNGASLSVNFIEHLKKFKVSR